MALLMRACVPFLIIGPDKALKLMMAYPMEIGRNFDEILRVVDAMQLAQGFQYRVSTPVN
jgi:alkyl hydroperoxide reductase subunit AhpC